MLLELFNQESIVKKLGTYKTSNYKLNNIIILHCKSNRNIFSTGCDDKTGMCWFIFFKMNKIFIFFSKLNKSSKLLKKLAVTSM